MSTRDIPADATSIEVVEAEPTLHRAVRWFPPGHPQHGDEQAQLLEDETVGEDDGNYTDWNHEPIQPGDWVVEIPADDHEEEYRTYTDAEFREAFRLPS